MDSNKSGLVISILAMVLAIPLAIVANFMTPYALNWYSTTSQERLTQRIAYLQEQLDKVKNEWMFTPADWEMYRTIVISELVSLFFGSFVFAVIFGVINRRPVLSVWLFRFQLAVCVVGCMTLTVLAIKAMNHSDTTRTLHSEQARHELRHELRRLKSFAGR